MPVSHEFLDASVVLRLTGSYTTADVRDGLLSALAGPAAPRNIRGLLFDVRESTVLATRSAADVRTMGRFLSSQADRFGRRIALVADSDATFGLMRLGAVTLEDQGVDARVFRDAVDATAWLGA